MVGLYRLLWLRWKNTHRITWLGQSPLSGDMAMDQESAMGIESASTDQTSCHWRKHHSLAMPWTKWGVSYWKQEVTSDLTEIDTKHMVLSTFLLLCLVNPKVQYQLLNQDETKRKGKILKKEKSWCNYFKPLSDKKLHVFWVYRKAKGLNVCKR